MELNTNKEPLLDQIAPTSDNDGLNPDIASAISVARNVFGFSGLRPTQKKVLETILQGRDTLAILPTGGGKSLCYALPAMMGEGMVVVISPLIALIRDQVVKMRTFGIPAAAVDSLQSPEEKRQVFDGLKQKRVKILFVSPERLSLPSFRALLSEQSLRLIAIDEAHCISQWGHHFRPEYRKIGHYLSDFPGVPKLALTATAQKNVRQDIVDVLHMNDPSIQINCPARKNIIIDIEKFPSVNDQLETLVEDIIEAKGQGIVYASTRKSVEQVTRLLKSKKESVSSYHGGLNSSLRDRVLRDFIDEKVRIVVATNAFGLGVDKSNIRFVFHFGVPQGFEQYIQEIGRGGRDGKPSFSKLYFTSRDVHIQKFILEKSFVEGCVLKLCADKVSGVFAEDKFLPDFELYRRIETKLKIKKEEAETSIDAFYRAGWISKWPGQDRQGNYITQLKVEGIPNNILSFIEEYEKRKQVCFDKLNALKNYIYSAGQWHQQIESYFNS